MSGKLLELLQPEIIIPMIDGVPVQMTCTHARMCNITLERMREGKEGYCQAWLEKGWIADSKFVIAPMVPGLNPSFSGQVYAGLMQSGETIDINCVWEMLLQFLVLNGSLQGTIVDDPTTYELGFA